MARTHTSTYGSTAAAAEHEVSKWVERLARLGYLAKGVVYAIVGYLAAQLAFGSGGQTTGSKGALRQIAEQPWGQTLLALTGFGLACYALWKLVQGLMDPEHKGTDAKGLATRAGFVGSGVVHASLALYAFGMAFGTALGGGGGGGGGAQGWTAKLMAQPWGQWLVGLAGLIAIAIGLRQFYNAYKEKFRSKWNLGEMSRRQERWGTLAAKWGLSARGVVFEIIGFFLLVAAWQAQPSEAVGLDGALTKLAANPAGPWVLGLVGLGLIAYAVFCFVKARYRHFNVA